MMQAILTFAMVSVVIILSSQPNNTCLLAGLASSSIFFYMKDAEEEQLQEAAGVTKVSVKARVEGLKDTFRHPCYS